MDEPIILDGKVLAAQIKQRIAAQTAAGLKASLATILVGEDVGSQKYVAGKHRDCSEAGIESIRVDLPADTSEAILLAEIDRLNQDPACTGYIVQLPLPAHINQDRVIAAIDPAKDADGLHPTNLGLLVADIAGTDDSYPQKYPQPCTPAGVIALLEHYHIPLAGKHVVVIGRGLTIGRSIGLLLTQKARNATVTLCHTGTRNLATHTKSADIIIAAAGSAHLVKPEMLPDDGHAVLIDVGVSRGPDSKITGDIDPACHAKCAAYSPNPGGVGPMTRAMLIQNVVNIAHSNSNNI